MAEAPPSEDQRNQQGTSAEVFAGVSRALMKLTPSQDRAAVWENHLDSVLGGSDPEVADIRGRCILRRNPLRHSVSVSGRNLSACVVDGCQH